MRLRRSVVSGPGFRRVRRGRGFSYHDQNGKALTDEMALTRIRELVIPPAWKKVWISPYPNGHIQAVGTDVAGRRQYLYHEQWQEERAEEKFDRVLEMSTALPDMRRQINRICVNAASNATVCSRWRFICSTSATSARAVSSTPRRTTRSVSQRCCASTYRLQRQAVEFDYPAKSGVRRTLTDR